MSFRPIFKIELVLIFIISTVSIAQNPLIMDQFTADPSARVFGDIVYGFPFYEIFETKENGRKECFFMENYHAVSSVNLTDDWTAHGMTVQQNKMLCGNQINI